MEKIIKEIELKGGIKLKVVIIEGLSILTANYAKGLIKIYHQIKQEHPEKDLTYNYRRNCIIETFTKSIEEYEKDINKDFESADKITNK